MHFFKGLKHFLIILYIIYDFLKNVLSGPCVLHVPEEPSVLCRVIFMLKLQWRSFLFTESVTQTV